MKVDYMALPTVSGKDVMKALEKAGFEITGGKKNHVRMKRNRKSASDTVRIAIIPRHNKIAKGTLRSIIRQAGMTIEEFRSLL